MIKTKIKEEEITGDGYFNNIINDSMRELRARRSAYLFSNTQVQALKFKIEKYNNETDKDGNLKHDPMQISVKNNDGIYTVTRHDRKIKNI